MVPALEHSALMKVFREAGDGILCAPSAIENEVCLQYGVEKIGHTKDMREHLYLISMEYRRRNPAVVAVSQAAHQIVFCIRLLMKMSAESAWYRSRASPLLRSRPGTLQR